MRTGLVLGGVSFLVFWFLAQVAVLVWGQGLAERAGASHGGPWHTLARVGVASDGTEANGSSDSPNISADGRYGAFASWASNLVVCGHPRHLGRLMAAREEPSTPSPTPTPTYRLSLPLVLRNP